MTSSSDDEQWDGATEHDDSAQMDGEDQPTMRATDDQRSAARGRALAQRLAEVGEPKSSERASRRRSTAQGLSAERPRTPASGVPIGADADPASTNRGMPTAPRTPAASTPPPGGERRLPLPASRLPDRGSGTGSESIGDAALAAADAAASVEPRTTARGMPIVGREPAQGDDQFVLLDRVSSSASTESSPRRSESASGGVVIVATGGDAERVRKLCHAHSLLVPVMGSLAIAHEALSVVVIGEPSPPAPERVVHVVRPSVPDDQLVDLLRALVTGYVIAEPPTASGEIDPRAIELAQRLSKLDDRGAVEMITIEAVTSLVSADRAHCLFFDPGSGALWSEALLRTRGDSRRAMGGLVGWAAYTGQTLHASPAGDDPRWLKELDDPEGKAQARLMVQPIIGGDRRVHAVLVAARRWRHSPFSDAELAKLKQFAVLVSPVLDVAAAGEGWKRRPSATIPGPLASAVHSGGTAAARQSAIVAPPSRPPTNPPPLTVRKPPTEPPPLTAKKPATNPPALSTAASPPALPQRSPTGPAAALPQRSPTGPAAALPQRSPTGPAAAIPQRSPAAGSAPVQQRSPIGPPPIQQSSPSGPAPVSQQPIGPAPANVQHAATGPAHPHSGRAQAVPSPVAAKRPTTDPPPAPVSKRPPTDPPPAPGAKRATTDRGTGAPSPPSGVATTHWSGVWSATNPPGGDPDSATPSKFDTNDSRPKRVPTKQPPTTSNTGRTKVPTGERSTSRTAGLRRVNKVAVVAGNDEHGRLKRIMRTCGVEPLIVTSTDEAPADARIVTIGQAWSPDLDPRVVYVARTSISDDALVDLLTAVATGRSLVPAATIAKPTNPTEARRVQIAFTGSRSFAATLDLPAAELCAVATVSELLDAERAYFLLYDDTTNALRSPTQIRRSADDRRAIAGLAGWVAHTGRSTIADRATADPRWLAPIDDPDGDPNSQLLVEPVIGSDQHVLAVIIAARRPRRPGFTELDSSLAARFAALVAPTLEQLKLHMESDQLIAEAPPDKRDPLLPRTPIEDVLARVRTAPRWVLATAAGVVLLLLILLIAKC